MKVRLLVDIPIDPIHGLVKGKEIEVEEKIINENKGYWWEGGSEPVKLFQREFEVIENDNQE